MEKSDYKIHIIGAGISGLIAAQVLENFGYCPTVLEATNEVGGRIKTDLVEGYKLDHGFQVLLSAYPAAKKYLNYKDLNLQELLPGASIFKDGKQQVIGDPLRKFSLLFSTLFSSVGSFSDKLKVLKLNKAIQKKSLEAIFSSDEKTTLQYLKDFGFSDKMVANFFSPFFSGIFLEDQLETSSRMFEFVYKMFGEGTAMIPKDGIMEISNQLKNKLKQTTIQLNTSVKSVKSNAITLENSEELETHFTIIATTPSTLISNLKNQEIVWKSCDTLYFTSDDKVIKKPLIGLIADETKLVNTIFYHTSIPNSNKGNKQLLSVTVVKAHELSEKELITVVLKELTATCNIKNLTFLKRYQIKKALPKLSNLQYELSSTETQLTSTTFLAGDHLLNGSLNAAMIAGERAALGVIKTLEGGVILDELTSDSI